MTRRYFPLMGGSGGQVLWDDAVTAYKGYVAFFGERQTLERMAERGGMGAAEFVYLFHGLLPIGHGHWLLDECHQCHGVGEVILSDDGGMPALCGVCMGAGGVLPKVLPPCRKATEK